MFLVQANVDKTEDFLKFIYCLECHTLPFFKWVSISNFTFSFNAGTSASVKPDVSIGSLQTA